MPNYQVRKSKLSGELQVPSSKSHTLRAILFASLADGHSTIRYPLASTDTAAMIQACQHFGAHIQYDSNQILIDGLAGKIICTEDVINAGNSGIVLRFCAAVGALSGRPVVITGDHSIRHQRRMQDLVDGLQQLGVSAVSMRGDGYAPVIIQGPLKPGCTTITGTDSQPVSALLIASAFAPGPTQIRVKDPGEKPWVGLTLDWFDRLEIPYDNENYELYKLKGNAKYKGFDYTVPGDFSSAAFPIAAALITQSDLTIHNIDMKDPQGDKAIIKVLQKMGAQIQIDEAKKSLHVKKGSKLSGTTIDINDLVDAITILAVIGCFSEGETRIINGAVARHKECNRIGCITAELKKMGAHIRETDDGLIIQKSILKGAAVGSHKDHRMAMSLAVAGLGAEGETVVTDTDCVSKTFDGFHDIFAAIGAHIKQTG